MGIFDRLRGNRQQPRSARLSQRIAVELRAQLRAGSAGELQSVFLEDLSTGGARVSTPLRLSRSARYTLIVDHIAQTQIAAPCRIVSSRPRPGELHIDYGLAFDALSPAALDKVRKLVDTLQVSRTGSSAFSAAHGR